MKIAYNPKSGAALQTAPDNNDITFDLAGKIIYARGEGFKGTDTTYDIFRKASESVGGYNGLVPAPNYNSNSKNRFLKEDGTWVIPDAGTFDGMDSDRFVTTHNISEADTDKRSINVRFEPKWTDTNSSSYILRVGSSTEGLPDNNCGDGNLLHIQGRFSDTAFQLLSGWYNNSLYFRSGNEVDGVDNTTKEEADTGLFKNAWNRIPFFTDLTGSNIKLTGYQWDANNFESITSNDTVSSALSKLECKAQFVYSWLTSNADDADEKINKWHEVEHFLEGIEETTLNSILNTKADKATTLAGYGITDAMPYLGTVDANSVKSSGYAYVTANGAGGNGSLIAFGGTSYQTQLYADYLGGNLYWRVNANGTYTSWAKIATKGTTLAHYGITDAVKYCYGADDIRHSASGYAQITHGGKVNGMLLSGIYKETSLYGGQLNGAFDGSSIWYRGLNNGTFTEWKRLAFKETTLSGYGITDAVPFLNMVNASNLKSIGVGYVNANGANRENGGIISFGSASYQTQIHSDHSGGNIHWRVNKNGTLTNWKNLLDSNNYSKYAVTLDTAQTITGEKIFQQGTGNIPLRIRNTTDFAFIQAGSSGTNNTASLAISGLSTSMLTSLQVYATNTAFHGSISTSKISGITDSSVVANLHAQYSTNLMGDDNRNVNEAPYSYGTCAVNWRFKRAKAIGLATNDYEYAGVLHLTPWGDKTGGPDHQLAFESNGKIKYRSGLSTWSDWTELLTDANGVTLGTEQIVTGHKTFKNDGYYTSTFNSTLSDGKVRLLLLNNGEAKLMLAYDGLGSFLYDYGSEQTLRIQNDGDLLFTKNIIASSQLKSNVATGTSPLAVNSTTMVANLNANYLGGLNKDSFQKAVYDYVNVSGTADTTALPTVIAPSIYNGTNSIGGNFKYYDTKFYNGRSNTSNRCQLAYGYDVDSIHFRRYKDGTWYDWKKVVFTEGTDNLKITNSSARTTYVKDSTHSMFFGYSDGSYNRGLYDNSQSNWIMYTDSSNQTFINQWLGNVGIKTGNATLTAALQVGGSILASGDITAYSDRRLKSNIQTLENRGYVEPVTFEKDGKQCIGFIAQDVEEKYPELVNSEGEYLSLNYQQYTAVLQAQIIELDKRIKELENGFSKQ